MTQDNYFNRFGKLEHEVAAGKGKKTASVFMPLKQIIRIDNANVYLGKDISFTLPYGRTCLSRINIVGILPNKKDNTLGELYIGTGTQKSHGHLYYLTTKVVDLANLQLFVEEIYNLDICVSDILPVVLGNVVGKQYNKIIACGISKKGKGIRMIDTKTHEISDIVSTELYEKNIAHTMEKIPEFRILSNGTIRIAAASKHSFNKVLHDLKPYFEENNIDIKKTIVHCVDYKVLRNKE